MTPEPAQLRARYEELRASALAHRPSGHGIALLQHRGTPAWMAAWQAVPSPVDKVAAAGDGPLPAATGSEVALVLTNMALALVGR